MKLFRHSTPAPPARRQVGSAGRTNLYAYYARRSAEPTNLGRQVFREALSARTAQRAARYWTRRFGLLLVIIALIIGVISLLSLSTDAKVLPVDPDQPPTLHSVSAYEAAADRLFSASVLNRNKLTVDTVGISRQLQHQFPELSVVTITLHLVGHRPIVYVAQADPAFLFEAGDGHAYVIDTSGRAIGDATDMSVGRLGLVHVRDQSATRIHIGDLILASSTVRFIMSVQYQLSQKGLKASLYELPSASSELDLHLEGLPYLVKFNLASDSVLQQIGSFLAVKHSLEGKGITPGAYIDVRLDGRAYYK